MLLMIITIAALVSQIIDGIFIYKDTKILKVVTWNEFWTQYLVATIALICVALSCIGD